MLKKIEKVKDFSFIRKGPIITETFSIKFKAILPPPPRCLFIIFVIVYNLYIIVTQKSS